MGSKITRLIIDRKGTVKMKKTWVAVVAVWLAVLSSINVYAGWEQDNYGWRYRNPDGSYFLRGDLVEDGKHYVIRSGYLVTNKWVGSHLGTWSYVGDDGALLYNTITPDGYFVNQNGNWVDVSGNEIISEEALTDYRNPEHNVDFRGPHSESDGDIIFTRIQNKNGWSLEDTGWNYYMNGIMLRNQWIEGKYYVGEDGVMLRNTFTPDGFYVGDDGAWVDYGKLFPSNTSNNSIVVQNPVDISGISYVNYNDYNSGTDSVNIQRSAASEAAYQQRRREAEQAYQQRRQAAEQAYQARHNGTSNQSYQERRAAADQAYKERRAAADKAYKERHKRK